ncbi:MAG: adenosylhomocysteinase [Dehalococcoidia bacterium]|jgi:adenosylhomocysteinase|nr:adenosylhomocysteinase [Dehalococcoidia bacterium]
MVTQAEGHVKDPALASQGILRIEWAAREMKVLRLIRERFVKEKPLQGMRLSGCLHVTTETANLAITLRDGGASVVLCASNPLSTQDDVAAALVSEYGIPTFAINGEDNATYYQHIHSTLEHGPHYTLDDGADLVTVLHKERTGMLKHVKGGTEETTTGVIRLRSMAREGKLAYPIIAINDADTKHLFDNRYGTGQSTLDGITRATNVLWAGKNVVVCGYGWCGRGIALRARGMGAHVIVTEVDPVRALEAIMDGYQVMPVLEASQLGDIFVTATGDIKVIDGPSMERMKDGAILANSGHFNAEIDIPYLESMSSGRRQIRPSVEEYTIKDGRKVYLLGEGRLINLAAAEGHPSSVMDMSFANQALCIEYLAGLKKELARDVHTVPSEIDNAVAQLKLNSLGIGIDSLTEEQKKYLESWEEGT